MMLVALLLLSCAALVRFYAEAVSDSNHIYTLHIDCCLRAPPEPSKAFPTITLVTEHVFPALYGEGVGIVLLQFPPGFVSNITEVMIVCLARHHMDAGLIDLKTRQEVLEL
jgi:hypothetical protein